MSDHQTTPADIVTQLRAVHDWWRAPGSLAEEAAAEIGRLRAIIRVNGLRAGASHAEIDEVINGKQS